MNRFSLVACDHLVDDRPSQSLIFLVRTGQTVDILFDVTNPGLWMAHCHIPEHQQSGMMVSFTVTRV
jgi:FtsP/CotA-like multicopper oxidase with cupredoxin domain